MRIRPAQGQSSTTRSVDCQADRRGVIDSAAVPVDPDCVAAGGCGRGSFHGQSGCPGARDGIRTKTGRDTGRQAAGVERSGIVQIQSIADGHRLNCAATGGDGLRTWAGTDAKGHGTRCSPPLRRLDGRSTAASKGL